MIPIPNPYRKAMTRKRPFLSFFMKRLLAKKQPQDTKREEMSSLGLFDDSLQVFLVLASLVSNAVSWALLFFLIGFGTETVVFHYNAYFGVDLTARAWQLVLLPTTSLLLFLGNTLLAFEFSRRRELAVSLSVSIMSLFVQVSVLIAVVALILVNT